MESCDTSTKSKVPHDPGWNDPPTLAYSPQQTTPNKPRNFLNKRVAFPLQGGSSPIVSIPVSLPPISTNVLLPPVQNAKSNNIQDILEIDSESTRIEVIDILKRLLDSNDLGSKTENIKKRISTMEDMWMNGKLNKEVQKQMKDLVVALQNNDSTLADNIHKSLMVAHVSEVCTWMPGIKQLIYHFAACAELLAIDQE